jgi:hypothetical protein
MRVLDGTGHLKLIRHGYTILSRIWEEIVRWKVKSDSIGTGEERGMRTGGHLQSQMW